jgi:transcriptional regulator with XRE-family HTH domain
MSRAPNPIDPTVSPRHRFGFMLRALRGQRGFSLQGFARRLGKSVSYLSAVELAQARCTAAFVADCERLLEAPGRLTALWAAANEDWDRRHQRQRITRERIQAAMAAAGTQQARPALQAFGAADADRGAAKGDQEQPAGRAVGRAGAALVVVSVEELAALIEHTTTRAVAACLVMLGAVSRDGDGDGHARAGTS